MLVAISKNLTIEREALLAMSAKELAEKVQGAGDYVTEAKVERIIALATAAKAKEEAKAEDEKSEKQRK